MYVPGDPPAELSDAVKEYLINELRKISEAFRTGEFESITLQEITASLAKPRDGDLINAAAANPDAGSGKGIYFFDGSVYNKL